MSALAHMHGMYAQDQGALPFANLSATRNISAPPWREVAGSDEELDRGTPNYLPIPVHHLPNSEDRILNGFNT